jgi:uncharacterized protein HemX
MNKTKKVLMLALLIGILVISVGSVIAKQQQPENGNAKGDTDRLRNCTSNDPACEQEGDQVPDRLRNGSCIFTVADKQQDMTQDQLREQLKDGSCCDCICKL